MSSVSRTMLAQHAGLAQAPQACGGEGHRTSQSRWPRTAAGRAAPSAPKATRQHGQVEQRAAEIAGVVQRRVERVERGLNGNTAETARITS